MTVGFVSLCAEDGQLHVRHELEVLIFELIINILFIVG